MLLSVLRAALAQRADRGFEPRIFADALGRAALLDPDDFAQYGVTGPALDDLRSRFAAWRRELLCEEKLAEDDPAPDSPHR